MTSTPARDAAKEIAKASEKLCEIVGTYEYINMFRGVLESLVSDFFRVLTDADRFPTEKELAEAAIAAKDELNTLRTHSQPLGGAEAAAEEISRMLQFSLHGMDIQLVGPKREQLLSGMAAIIRKHQRHTEGWLQKEASMNTEFTAVTLAADNNGAVTETHHIYSEKLGYICRCFSREEAEKGAKMLNRFAAPSPPSGGEG